MYPIDPMGKGMESLIEKGDSHSSNGYHYKNTGAPAAADIVKHDRVGEWKRTARTPIPAKSAN